MADKDLLGQSLSEEEELALPPPGKRSSSLSPSRTPKTRSAKGYKFTSESTSKPDNFDFATQSKNGNNHQPSTTGSSSEEGEEFEHLNPLEDGGGSGGDPPQVLPQVNKLPTPHKRTAELAENGDDPKSFKGFGNGSPPSSPAAKRSKNFQDYLAEDEAKRQQKLQETREGPPKEIGGDLGNLLKFGGIMVSILLAVGLAIYFSEVDIVNVIGHGDNQVEPQKISKYGWNSASEKIHRSLKQLEKQFPNQNRETWIQLHSSILSTFSKTEPVHPSAITLLYSSSLVSSKFPLCFTSKIAQAINSAVAPILQNVNSSKLAKPHPPKIITPELFEQQTITQIRIGLDNYFNLKGKALVVDKVTEVESEGDLLLFHGLCDNFKAVDKRATILFPVEVDKEVLGRFEWIHDRAGDISQDVLNTKFARIVGADTGPSIVARIADAVVLINEGDKCDD